MPLFTIEQRETMHTKERAHYYPIRGSPKLHSHIRKQLQRKRIKAMIFSTHDLTSAMSLRTASFVGKAGIAPFSVTVRAPQALAKRRASLNRSSSW